MSASSGRPAMTLAASFLSGSITIDLSNVNIQEMVAHLFSKLPQRQKRRFYVRAEIDDGVSL
ncbi:MAG: hypothetical protein ACYC7I_06520 [Gammaproteobacteria bacterium]